MQVAAETPPEVFFPALIVICIVAFVGGLVWLSIRQQRHAMGNLEQLGRELGLEVTPGRRTLFGPGMPRVQGTVRGRPIRVFVYTTGSGKSRTSWVALAATVRNPSALTLHISQENFLTRAGRAFGVDDVATGDPAFDAKFYVKSNDAGYVRAALIPEVRAALLAAAAQGGARGTFAVFKDELKYAETGTFASRRICARFPELVRVVCDLAEVVEARAG